MELVSFEWGVPAMGLRWTSARPGGKGPRASFLTPGVALEWRRYNPFLDTPALFRVFAALSPTAATVLQFANQYGALGDDEPIILGNGAMSTGERLRTWTTHIAEMQDAVGIWSALRQKDGQMLGRWFSAHDDGDLVTVRFRPDTPWPRGVPRPTGLQFVNAAGRLGHTIDAQQFLWEPIAASRVPSLPRQRSEPQSAGSQPHDATGYALAYLRAIVNWRLDVTLQLQSGAAAIRREGLALALHARPRTLLAAMWLQLALAIEGGVQYQRCEQCGDWFRVKTRAPRESTRFCKTACRVKWHRAHPKATHG
jgi:hypothetical protein